MSQKPTTMDERSKQIRMAGALGDTGEPVLLKYFEVYANLEMWADRMVALTTLEKMERCLSLANRIHQEIQELARTYEDEKQK